MEIFVLTHSRCCRFCRPGRRSQNLGRAKGPFSGPSLQGIDMIMNRGQDGTAHMAALCSTLFSSYQPLFYTISNFRVTHSNSNLYSSLTAGTPSARMESDWLELQTSTNTHFGHVLQRNKANLTVHALTLTSLTASCAHVCSPAFPGVRCGTPVWP